MIKNQILDPRLMRFIWALIMGTSAMKGRDKRGEDIWDYEPGVHWLLAHFIA